LPVPFDRDKVPLWLRAAESVLEHQERVTRLRLVKRAEHAK